ncbi:PE-PGRS family protein PE_PGRS26-like [Montipora capricornis]|uniref:PE-PGRS family protein PE_PGRS26-like n=1 Tax=Montipora capricornis TaxID=246305 RepID=UPI0035F16286
MNRHRMRDSFTLVVILVSVFHLGQTALSTCNSSINAVITFPCKFAPGIHSYQSLTISTEVFLETTSLSSQHYFNVSQTFNIQSTAIILLDYNRDSTNNPGAGVSGNISSSGGSFGGRAGAASNTPLSLPQAETYGNAFAVAQAGSWGGANSNTRAKGGGLLRIYARKLIIDGTVQVNGERAQENSNGGGGSGGGVSIDCYEIDGNGRLLASGGMGSGTGGGGAGGRISVKFDHGSFPGLAKAYGGKTENEVTSRGVSGNQLTASSTRVYTSPSYPYSTTYYYPSYASLGYTGGTGGWMPATNNIGSEYLEARLSSAIYITGVATQGRHGGSEYTRTYTLKYLDPYRSSPEMWRDVKVHLMLILCFPVLKNYCYCIEMRSVLR